MTNIVIMVVCVLVCIAALAVPYIMIKRRSSKLETGLPGAIGYGFLGYVWQYVIYMFLGYLTGYFFLKMGVWNEITGILLRVVLTLVSTLCTAVSLYWGIYLTNQKQISIYRSAAVGIGFSLGKMGIDLIFPYVSSVYFSFQINNGTFAADSNIETSILASTPGSLIIGTYKCLLMFVIIFAIALIMGKYYIEKNRRMVWLSVLCIYEVTMLLNFILMQVPGVFSDIAFIIVFTVIAAAAGLVLWNWFKTDEVEVNPIAVFRKLRG